MPLHISSSCYWASLIRAVHLTFYGIGALSLIATTHASPLYAQEFSAGLHVGGPVRAALAVGAIWMRPTGGDHGQGPILLVEPGLGGHRISAGYLFARGNLGQFASVRATVGWSLTSSVTSVPLTGAAGEPATTRTLTLPGPIEPSGSGLPSAAAGG